MGWYKDFFIGFIFLMVYGDESMRKALLTKKGLGHHCRNHLVLQTATRVENFFIVGAF
jgi:hypothetical protein